MKRSIVVIAAVVAGSACVSATSGTESESSSSRGAFWDVVETKGAFRLAVRDSAARAGVLFALPTIQSLPNAIVVENTRYGSLCASDVTGRADVQGQKIGVHIAFTDRLTSCPGGPRALSYQATLSELTSGASYDVAVIHEENGRADTVRSAVVVVR